MTPPHLSRESARDLRALVGLLLCLSLLAGLLAGAVSWMSAQVPDVNRIEGAFEGLNDRPPAATGAAAGAVNILVLGTDRRSDQPTTGTAALLPSWLSGAQRSDTTMLVHIDADRRAISAVSIPRDSWVTVPGHGEAKVNAAYSFGGVPLAVETVEALTGVRVDHVAVVDGDGFSALVDLAGGVRVDVPQTVTDSARAVTWEAGTHLLDGDAALDYVGQRYGLPGGDLDRAQRQQVVLRTVLQSLLQTEMRSNPGLLVPFISTALEHISVDAEWSLRAITELAVSLRNLRSADIRFVVAPVRGFGDQQGQSVVYLDESNGTLLWTAMREDSLDRWWDAHPERETPEVVA